MGYFTDEQEKYMLALHGLSGANVEKGIKLFYKEFGINVSPPTLKGRWIKADLPLAPPRARKNSFDEQEFRKLYSDCRGKILIMGVRSGKKRSWLEERCKDLGLEFDI